MKIALLLLLAGVAAAGDPRLVYTKSFPGSVPPWVSITVQRDGSAAFKGAPDDDPDTLQLEADVTSTMFDLADKLSHFQNALESGLNVAKMGEKTFRWEQDSENHEQKFNYSTDEGARLLQDWFERITESEVLMAQLKRAVRYDKLGVNDVTLRIQIAYDRKRLVGLSQLVPLLDRIAENETYINMARQRSRNLSDAFKQVLGGAAPKGPAK